MKFMASRNWLWTDVSVAFCLTWTLCGILLFVLLVRKQVHWTWTAVRMTILANVFAIGTIHGGLRSLYPYVLEILIWLSIGEQGIQALQKNGLIKEREGARMNTNWQKILSRTGSWLLLYLSLMLGYWQFYGGCRFSTFMEMPGSFRECRRSLFLSGWRFWARSYSSSAIPFAHCQDLLQGLY